MSKGPRYEFRKFARRLPTAARARLLRVARDCDGKVNAMARVLQVDRWAIAQLVASLDLTIELREIRERRAAEARSKARYDERAWHRANYQRKKAARAASGAGASGG